MVMWLMMMMMMMMMMIYDDGDVDDDDDGDDGVDFHDNVNYDTKVSSLALFNSPWKTL